MSPLVTVDTEFVSFGNLTLFALDIGKGSFVGRVISFLCSLNLVVSRFVTVIIISLGMFVVGRRRFVVGLTGLYTIKREKNCSSTVVGMGFLSSCERVSRLSALLL